jgi:predicted MFS family arabinose efflux permease
VVLGALWILVFAVTSQSMILAPILPTVARQLRVGEARLAAVAAGYSLAVAAVALVAGPVSDRFGRRAMLLAGSGAMAVALAAHAAVHGYGGFLLVRVLTGAAGGVLTGAAAAYVGDYFPAERHGWANGWVMSGMAAGQVLGIPAGTVLAGRWGFAAPFLIFAAAMAMAFGVMLLWLPKPRVALRREPVTPRYLARHYRALLGRRAAVTAMLAWCATFVASSLYLLYLPAWLEAERGVSTGQVAALFAAGGVATVIAGPMAGRASDRMGRKRLIVVSSLALAVAMLMTPPLARGLIAAGAIFVVVSALTAARAAPLQSSLVEVVPDAQRGTLMSLSMAAGQAGAGVGNAVAGAAYATSGYGLAAALAAAASALVAVVVRGALPETAGREPRRDEGTTGHGARAPLREKEAG